MLKISLIAVLALTPVHAGVVFSDDFETGSLSAARWLVPGSGVVVNDPLNAGNRVLSFGQLKAGGDVFTVPLDLSSPIITVSFDYLGIASGPNVGTDTGGFIIVDLPNSFSGYVLLGTSTSGAPVRSDMLNLTVGIWHHIELTFPSSLIAAGNGSKFTFEQWSGSPNAAGNAYFDNIVISTVPEPNSLVLAGFGVALILAGRTSRLRR